MKTAELKILTNDWCIYYLTIYYDRNQTADQMCRDVELLSKLKRAGIIAHFDIEILNSDTKNNEQED